MAALRASAVVASGAASARLPHSHSPSHCNSHQHLTPRATEAAGMSTSSPACKRPSLACCHVSRRGLLLSSPSSKSGSRWDPIGVCVGRQDPAVNCARRRGVQADSAAPHSHATRSRAVVNADHLAGKSERSGAKVGHVIDLKQWMEENGLPPCKVSLADRTTCSPELPPIHRVVASEDLQTGDTVLQVPSSLVVTLERVLGDETIAELLTTNKLSELACLALYLMYEKKRGKESFWYPYIRELDRQRGRGQLAVESPLLWSRSELNEYFAGSPTRHIFAERLEGIKREYKELDTVWFMAGSLFKQYPFDIPTEAFPFEIFRQAFVAVQSCVVHLQGVNLARRFALVPLGPPLLSYRSDCKAMLRAVGSSVELQVDRPYKAGEPIAVWCGPQSNAKLLLNYGYVDEDNPYDRLVLEAALNTEDPLYQKKRAIVQKNDKSTLQQFMIFRGKEEQAVLDMLPYFRFAHITDPSKLDSFQFAAVGGQVAQTQVSACNERAVLSQLSAFFKSRLREYTSTVEEDDILIANPDENPKKVVAARLLRIEKKMLIAVLEVVRGMIRQLPPDGISPCYSEHSPTLSL